MPLFSHGAVGQRILQSGHDTSQSCPHLKMTRPDNRARAAQCLSTKGEGTSSHSASCRDAKVLPVDGTNVFLNVIQVLVSNNLEMSLKFNKQNI